MISKETFLAALEEIDNAIFATLPEPEECSFQFSERFERKMRSIIRRGNHPIMYKALQRVACMLLILLMLFSSVMIFSTDARAVVIGWIKEQYETFYHYFFPTETETAEKDEYTLGWVPDGYVLANSFSSPDMATQVYLHSTGNMIQFTYLYGTEKTSDYIDSEDYECYEVAMKETTAEIFISTSPEKTNGILWEDETSHVFFSISAPLQESELLQLAQGVKNLSE